MLECVYTNYRTEIYLFIQDGNVEMFPSACPHDDINIVVCPSNIYMRQILLNFYTKSAKLLNYKHFHMKMDIGSNEKYGTLRKLP